MMELLALWINFGLLDHVNQKKNRKRVRWICTEFRQSSTTAQTRSSSYESLPSHASNTCSRANFQPSRVTQICQCYLLKAKKTANEYRKKNKRKRCITSELRRKAHLFCRFLSRAHINSFFQFSEPVGRAVSFKQKCTLLKDKFTLFCQRANWEKECIFFERNWKKWRKYSNLVHQHYEMAVLPYSMVKQTIFVKPLPCLNGHRSELPLCLALARR